MQKFDRPLGSSEKWYWLCDKVSPLNVVLQCTIEGEVKSIDWDRAVRNVQKRFALLQCHIVEKSTEEPHFKSSPVVEIPISMGDMTSTDFESVIEYELNTRIDYEKKALARIVILRTEEKAQVFITVSHIVADGLMGVKLINALLSEITGGKNPTVGQFDAQILAPVESMFPRFFRTFFGACFGLWLQIKVIFKQIFKPATRLFPKHPIPAEDRRTMIISNCLPPADTNMMLELSRRTGTTVHALASAGFCKAVSQLFAPQARELILGHPMNFRHHLVPAAPLEAGCLVSTFFTFPETNRDILSMAKALKSDITRRLQRGEHFAALSFLIFFGPRTRKKMRAILANVERFGPGNLAISNMGKVPLVQKDGWKISGVSGFASLSVYGYLLSIISFTNNDMHWNICAIDKAFARDKLTAIVPTAVEYLRSTYESLLERGGDAN